MLQKAPVCGLTMTECKLSNKTPQVLDNPALDAIASQQLGHANPTVDQMNSLAALAMAGTTATLRFPGAHPLRMLLLHCLAL